MLFVIDRLFVQFETSLAFVAAVQSRTQRVSVLKDSAVGSHGGSGGTQSINRSTSGSPQWLPSMDMVSAITPNLLHVKPRCG